MFAVTAYHPVGATPCWQVADMFVPDAIRRCVVFLGVKGEDGRFLPKATGFLADAGEGDYLRTHLITAEHVITNIQNRIVGTPNKLAARLNAASGGSDIVDLSDAHWWYHPNLDTDVAVTPFSFARDQSDQAPWLLKNRDISDEIVRAEGGALGQEILILGLFRHHTGMKRNEPIVRIGNLSGMPTEPVKTRYAGDIKGYLVEARSISGLSGSPVFLNLVDILQSNVEVSQSALETALKTKASKDTLWIAGRAKDHTEEDMLAAFAKVRADNIIDLNRYPLLGLMHGHWDVPEADTAVIEDVDGRSETVNVGIGVVIPAVKILETVYQSELVEERARLQMEDRNKNGAVPDLDAEELEPPTKVGNPRHKEDFNRLLGEAMKGPKSDD
jgi:hypothetical protein